MPTTAQKRQEFRRLHESGCFVMPNSWDLGSARYLQGLGFQALATTSSGSAWSNGRSDGAMPREAVLAHLAEIAGGTDVPLNADFENGHGETPEDVARSVALAIAAGVSGLSIEDATGVLAAPLFDLPLAVERLAAARSAIDASGTGVVLTARAECYLVGRPDLRETIARLTAYAEAGADCLYAPGVSDAADIATIVKGAAPRPVNVLASTSKFSVAKLRDLGVRRISVGGALARAAWGEFMRAAREIADSGSFGGFDRAAPFAEVDGLFRDE